jgi:hypothetical protein
MAKIARATPIESEREIFRVKSAILAGARYGRINRAKPTASGVRVMNVRGSD